MTIKPSLLPPNATRLERGLEQATARLGDVPTPARELWNPATCPLELLPWLAWSLSIDRWEIHWSEAEKRAAVASAIEQQRKKGTPASVEAVLASFDELLKLTEWFEMQPQGEPHTFTVELPLLGPAGSTGGFRSTAEFAEAIVRDVIRTKPVRSHFTLVQSLAAEGNLRAIAAARMTAFRRADCLADTTVEPDWALYLQDENGEPLTDESGNLLQEGGLNDEAPTGATLHPHWALALDFTRAQYLKDGEQFATLADVGMTFTRGSSATRFNAAGQLELVAANMPRFDHDPVTLEPLGLLVEEARTNLLLNSEGTASTYPTKGNVADAAPSIAGFANAVLFADNAVSRYAYKPANVTSGQTYTFTFFVEMLDGAGPPVITQSSVSGDLSIIIAGGANFATNIAIKPVGGNRYRVKCNYAATATTGQNFGVVKYNAQSARPFKVSGYQVELGAFSTSYIPTAASVTTRAADVARLQGADFASWYNPLEGTLCVEAIAASGRPPSGLGQYFASLTSSLTDRTLFCGRVTNDSAVEARTASGGTVFRHVGLHPDSTRAKYCGAYKSDDFAASVAGNAPVTDASAAVAPADKLGIGNLEGAHIANGHIQRLRYYPARLSNSALQELAA